MTEWVKGCKVECLNDCRFILCVLFVIAITAATFLSNVQHQTFILFHFTSSIFCYTVNPLLKAVIASFSFVSISSRINPSSRIAFNSAALFASK